MRGVLETIILTLWYTYHRLGSLLVVFLYRLRGYDIDASAMFYGRIWLQRSTKNSIIIEKNCNLGEQVKIRCYGKGKVTIGNHCSIGEFSIISTGDHIKIGNNVVTGAFCHINDTNHNFRDLSTPIIDQGWSAKGITIQDNVWIGANVTILDGVTVGRDSVIGAGSVVTKDVDDYTIVAGVPAKLLYKRR